jgi:CDP-glycerol glycerophosphotransferase
VPYLSIVMPVYGVQGYLRECLDSILSQTFTDFELIAVDDGSPDHCAEILDEFAVRDPRVRVVHRDTNVGLGRARNAGLDLATGEYVWFVDSDDWLAAGALHAVATKLRQTSPDILLVDHTRASWLGTHEPSDGYRVLRESDRPRCVTLADERRFLALFTVAWNKVVRRAFLLRTGIRFDVGWYEDLPFTYPLLIRADRIATLGRVCYHYRARRLDAITRTRSVRHFEVFEQWSRVFGHLDTLGERAAPFRDDVFGRMLWHLLVVLMRPDRLPGHARRAFFHQVSRHYHRYRPTDSAPPRTWRERARQCLVARDRYQLFRVLWQGRLTMRGLASWVAAAIRNTPPLARAMGGSVWGVVGRLYYHLLRLLPVDRRLAVYAAYWYRGFSCNPAAIFTKARELAPGVRGTWIVESEYVDGMPAGVPYVRAGTLRYYRTLARARWLVNNVNFPDFVVKRPGSVHLQTHHGTPVKVMGVEQVAYPVGAQGLHTGRLMRRSDRWDYSISANAHSTEVWARSYPCRYQTLEYGYPRNDRLARADAGAVAAARDLLGIDQGATVVLYAPTYREYVTDFRPLVDIEELADAIAPGGLLLVRAHYFYASSVDVSHPSVRDVSAYPCIEDVFLATDVLVTDYSSVMFDYVVLDRPVVVYAPDWDAYARTRGVTFDVLAEPPGVVATTPADLVDAFRTGTVWGDAASKARAQFRARFCALDDGRAAERVVRHVFAGVLR